MDREWSPLSAEERLVFHHIPKTAGTSLKARLASDFLPEQVLSFDAWERQTKGTAENLKKARFITGHFNFFDVNRIPGPKRVITILRDPVDRILSLYYFWLSMTDDYVEKLNQQGPRLAKQRDLLSFLRSEENVVRYHLDNSLTRNFLPNSRYPLSPELVKLSQPQLVRRAMNALRSYYFVGFQENFDEDSMLIQQSLGFEPKEALKHNVMSDIAEGDEKFQKVERETITPEISLELSKLTRIDSIFYTMARAERHQLRPHPARNEGHQAQA